MTISRWEEERQLNEYFLVQRVIEEDLQKPTTHWTVRERRQLSRMSFLGQTRCLSNFHQPLLSDVFHTASEYVRWWSDFLIVVLTFVEQRTGQNSISSRCTYASEVVESIHYGYQFTWCAANNFLFFVAMHSYFDWSNFAGRREIGDRQARVDIVPFVYIHSTWSLRIHSLVELEQQPAAIC